jgi:hypothetical protein
MPLKIEKNPDGSIIWSKNLGYVVLDIAFEFKFVP